MASDEGGLCATVCVGVRDLPWRVALEGGMRNAPSREEVLELVFRLLGEFAKVDTRSVSEKSTIEHDMKLESIAFIEIQVALEEEYNIELDPICMVELNELGLIVDYIYSRAGASPE